MRSYDDLVERIYAGAGEPREWIAALPDICAYVGGEVGQLVVADPERRITTKDHFYALTPNRDLGDVHRFVEEYGSRDPRRSVYMRRFGQILTDRDIEPSGFERSGIVADYLDRMDIRRHLVCAIRVPNGAIATLSVMRSERAGHYDGQEAERFGRVMRHLQQSFRLHGLITDAAAGGAVLDLVAAPILVVDAAGELVFANSAAQAEIDGDRLRLRQNRLSPARPADRDRMLAALATVAGEERAGLRAAPASWQVVDAQTGKLQRYLIARLPERHVLRPATGPGCLAVLIGLAASTTPLQILRSLYGLTLAEARIAQALGEGQRLKELAERLGISLNTGRDHLKAIFRKMQIDSQSALVLAVREAISLPLTTGG